MFMELRVMSESAKRLTPPYATFGSFISFLDKLRESGVPARIDPSVFGNASGTLSYSIIAALKYLRLIDEKGTPSQTFVTLVNGGDEERKPLLSEIIRGGYPTLFGEGIDLSSISAGQFDEHIRGTYEVQGSTVDKIAAFFIGAAKFAKIEISPHLKARKPISASPNSRKSSRQRKNVNIESTVQSTRDDLPQLAQDSKPLEYQLIDLMSQPDIEDEIKNSIWNLVQYLTARKTKKGAASTE